MYARLIKLVIWLITRTFKKKKKEQPKDMHVKMIFKELPAPPKRVLYFYPSEDDHDRALRIREWVLNCKQYYEIRKKLLPH